MFRLSRNLYSALLVLSLAMMALVSGFRSFTVGTDSPMYVAILDSPRNCPTEKGYCLLNGTLNYFGMSYTVLFVIESILLYTAIGLFICFYIDQAWWGFACLMLIGTRIFFIAMNISRQYVAVALVLLALLLFEEDHKIPSLILMGISITVHYSASVALIALLILPWVRSKNFKKTSIIIVLLSFIVHFANLTSFANQLAVHVSKYEGYSGNLLSTSSGSPSIWTLYSLLLSCIFIALIVLKDDEDSYNTLIKTKNKESAILLSGSFCFVVTNNLFPADTLLNRSTEYFSIFLIWMCYAFLCKLNRRLSRIMGFVVLIIFFYFCYIQVYERANFGVVPYISSFASSNL
jgi:hypothetical protein